MQQYHPALQELSTDKMDAFHPDLKTGHSFASKENQHYPKGI